MKTLALLAIVAFACLCGQAKTFVNYIVPNSGLNYSTNVIVPTNTIAKIVNFNYAGSLTSAVVTITYAGTPTFASVYPAWLNTPIMGPVTLNVAVKSQTPTGNAFFALAEFDPVNTTPQLAGFAVQPNGKTASITLESSTNLTTWTTATNGTYPATNRAQFYRMNFNVP
jgi:hypothetical protein